MQEFVESLARVLGDVGENSATQVPGPAVRAKCGATEGPPWASGCPLLGAEQTLILGDLMSACSHKRTLALQHIGELQTYDSSSSSVDLDARCESARPPLRRTA